MNKSNEEWIQLNIQILVQQFSLQSDNMLTSHVEWQYLNHNLHSR